MIKVIDLYREMADQLYNMKSTVDHGETISNENFAMMPPREYERLKLADEIVQMELFRSELALEISRCCFVSTKRDYKIYCQHWHNWTIEELEKLYKQYKAL